MLLHYGMDSLDCKLYLILSYTHILRFIISYSFPIIICNFYENCLFSDQSDTILQTLINRFFFVVIHSVYRGIILSCFVLIVPF